MSSRQKVVSGVVWSVVVNMTNAIYGFIAAPLLISYFGKSEYGLIALANSVNGYMALMDMGLNSTTIRFFSNWLAKGEKEKVRKLLQTCTAFYGIVGLINAVVLLIVCIFTDKIFSFSAEQATILKHIFILLACMAVVNWYSSCLTQLITATENVAWVQKRTLLTKLLMIAVLIGTLVFKLSIIQFVFATQIVTLILLPMTIIKVVKETPFVSFWARFDMPTFKQILPYSLNIFSFGIFQFSFYNLRTVFLGIQSTPEVITEYNVMNSLVGLTTAISTVFMGALLPSSSRIVAIGDKENYYRIAYQGTKFITICLCFCAMGMMTICDDLMMVYVGESFMHIIPWFMLWLVLVVIGSHNQSISSLILAGTDVRAITINTMFSSVIGLIVTWIAIPYYMAGGPIIAYAVYVICQILFYWIYYWPKKMKIKTEKVLKE
jgi:O-antigen/teichoic acid export membrane protein